MMKKLLTSCWLTMLTIWLGCASISDNAMVPVMGMRDKHAVEALADTSEVLSPVVADSAEALAQTLLILPFEDASKYKGPWQIHLELARGLADSLMHHSFLRAVSLDSVLVRLHQKEYQGQVSLDRGLQLADQLGADYLVFGRIEELSMRRFRATMPVGGYRSYEGLTRVTLNLIKTIDQQSAGQLTCEGVEDTRRYGITNPASFVPYEREYFIVGDMEWGSKDFRDTLLGKSVQECLMKLAAGLDGLIKPPADLTVSNPKIIDVDGLQAYINVGLVDAVQNGDKFGVWDGGRALTDPGTGLLLGHALPRRVGVVQVEQVLSDHLSVVRILEGRQEIRREFSIRAE